MTVGESMELDTPAGSYTFRVTGFRSDDSRYANNNGSGETTALLVDEDQVGVFMNISAFRRIMQDNSDTGSASYYVQFGSHANMKKAIAEIKESAVWRMGRPAELYPHGDGRAERQYAGENVYPLVIILFLLVLIAGVLMISGSLNSTIAQRTQFFGMMRCVGMSKQQVVRFVRLEALNWCKTAVPIGVLLGTFLAWGAECSAAVSGWRRIFRKFRCSGERSRHCQRCGARRADGLIAAQSPAKRAARVSPIAAVSGNAADGKRKPHRAKARFLKIESSLVFPMRFRQRKTCS